MLVFTWVVLSVEGLIVTKSTPREVNEELNNRLFKAADTLRKKFVLPWWK
jgi:hypothetical protein